ncbi:MAG: YraN family protein [Bacteroidota bacterium]
MSKDSAPHMDTGRYGEDLAAQFLENRGMRVMERNYRFERAEVDLICFEPATEYARGGELVFVEVKTRRGTAFGRPEEAISEAKQRNMARAAEAWLHERRMDGSPCRFDVVGVVLTSNGRHTIEHFRDAFWAPGLSGFPT